MFTKLSMSSASACRKQSGVFSEAAKVSRSMAVMRVCLRDGTKTITGFRLLCFITALNAGLEINLH